MRQDRTRPIHQLSIRGLDPATEKEIRRLAKEEGLSLNKAALKLLQKGAGVGGGPTGRKVGDSLNHLLGTWSEEEYREFEDSMRWFEQIVPQL